MSRHARTTASAVGVLLLLSLGSEARGQRGPVMPDSVRSYLDSALAIMQHNVLGGDTVNWGAFRDSVFRRAADADVPADTYRTIRWALRTLNPHSFLQLSRELRDLEEARAPRPAASENAGGNRRVVSPFSAERRPEGEMFRYEGRAVGRVRVPSFGASHLTAFADSLEAVIRELDTAGACGWIVDLRGNGGGNMWPMLAGIGSLVGTGTIGEFHGPRGLTGTWYYEDGASGIIAPNGDVNEIARISGAPYRVAGVPPVAVLYDGGTASSGEAVAIAFIGRANTRSFGVPSYGFTTANNGYRLPDNANIVLTVGVNADRNGRAYPTALQPDVVVQMTQSGAIPAAPPDGIDPQEEAALRWLARQPGCALGGQAGSRTGGQF